MTRSWPGNRREARMWRRARLGSCRNGLRCPVLASSHCTFPGGCSPSGSPPFERQLLVAASGVPMRCSPLPHWAIRDRSARHGLAYRDVFGCSEIKKTDGNHCVSEWTGVRDAGTDFPFQTRRSFMNSSGAYLARSRASRVGSEGWPSFRSEACTFPFACRLYTR